MMPSRSSAAGAKGTKKTAHKAGSVSKVVMRAAELFCNPFPRRNANFIPILGAVLPDLGIQQGLAAERPLVHDAIDESIGCLLTAGFIGQQPEILEILQTPALRLQADARNRLLITHHRAAIDQLAGAVINAIGAVLIILGLIPRRICVPIEFPLYPARSIFPTHPADATIHQQIA